VIIRCYLAFLAARRAERYGLKVYRDIRPAFFPVLAVIVVAAVLIPSDTCGQSFPAWWGSASWFDWSDFRADLNGRVMLAKMTAGKITGASINNDKRITISDGTIDFRSDLGMDGDPDAFKEIQATIYIDRLGLRMAYDGGRVLTGRRDWRWTTTPPIQPDQLAVSEFVVESGRLGLDVDLIRYPFLRVGIDFDYHTNRVTLTRRYWYDFSGAYPPHFIEHAHSVNPMTIGCHATAIPARVREVPVILQGRFRFPVPFLSQIPILKREYEARVTDIELSAGLRPSVWETSLFGHTTFSVGVLAGYRWQSLEGRMTGARELYHKDGTTGPTEKFDFKVNAAWEGAFVQLKAAF
jgi:hypothetical protein